MKAKQGDDLLRQEREVEELLATVASEVIGSRLCRARKRQGLSVRDLAARANVNKNSVVRLENGGMPQPLTLLKICAALGLHVATIAQPAQEDGELVSVHRHEDDRWYDMLDFAAGPLAERPLTEKERRELGLATPILMLKNRLETGQILTRVIELYEASPARSHLGEEMVYVLSGRATITIGRQVVHLDCGESATFWSSEEHIYAPAEGSVLPVRLLSATVHTANSKS